MRLIKSFKGYILYCSLSLVLLIISNIHAIDIRIHGGNNYQQFGENTHLNISSATSRITCKKIWSSSIREYVTCCRNAVSNSLSCLPSFIIAGVQKGGTTALSALLCTLKSITFSKKKELHFFDSSKKYDLGLHEYIKHFPIHNETALNIPIFGESTPFYIASRLACKRIAEMIPDIKIIILLREPISRAYTQEEFIDIAVQHGRILSQCLQSYAGKWGGIRSCLPSELTEHCHYGRLIANLKMKARTQEIRTGNESSSTQKRQRKLSSSKNQSKGATLTATGRKASIRSSKSRTNTISSNRYPSQCAAPNQSRNPRYLHWCDPDIHSVSQKEKEATMLWVRLLLGKYGSERLPPLEHAFGTELREWEQCAGDLVGPNMTVEGLDLAVEKCLEKKNGINMGIGKQFFYRSLYAVQLHNCFKYIDRRRFILVSSERLQSHPLEVLQEIVSFIGLKERISLDPLTAVGGVQPDNQELSVYPAKYTVDPQTNPFKIDETKPEKRILGGGDTDMHQFIGAAVGKYFPTFESNSGWKLKSEYDAIPPGLAVELQQFFAPYNELLFHLLGTRQFDGEWRGFETPYNKSINHCLIPDHLQLKVT